MVALLVLAGVLARLQRALGRGDVIGAETRLAFAAVDERIGEALDVAGCFPDPGMHEDRTVDSHHVLPALHDVAPPSVLDVALELDAERTVVPAARQPAVDLARLRREPTPFGEVHDLFHADGAAHDDGWGDFSAESVPT